MDVIWQIFWQIAALAALLVGAFFSFTGVLGFLRLPDVYTRLHASGKVSIFGVVLLLAAAAILIEDVPWWKAIVLMVFVLIASPSVSHAIASAAYRAGLKPHVSSDALADKLESSSKESNL